MSSDRAQSERGFRRIEDKSNLLQPIRSLDNLVEAFERDEGFPEMRIGEHRDPQKRAGSPLLGVR